MSSSNFKCSICDKVFSSIGNRNRHSQLLHGAKQNDIAETDFKAWLERLEKNENVRFFKPRGSKRNTGGTLEKFTLMCSRSGKRRVVPEACRKRNCQSQGSSKYNFGCTSYMIVTQEVLTRKCSVDYYSTHYGHDEELQHLRISKECRKEVAQKLLSGVSITRLLDSTRDQITEKLNRDDIIVRKDIHNIKNSFNINIGEGQRHKDDATSVHLWVKECLTSSYNPVHFFKLQGESTSEWNLNVNDFVLIFMNQIQVEILKKFGNNIICVDGTHGLNAYNFELTTVLVLDEFGEGFPVAFLFSNRQDTYIYELFFSYIKRAISVENEFICKVFMSDLAETYFNAWAVVMGTPKKQLYCSWHVDRAWQQNLSKVADPEKRKWVYKTLKHLQTNLQEDIFEKEYEEFLSLLRNEHDLFNMYNYLINHYFNNRFQWAYCYRKGSGINSNMHLESMHRVIKYIYLEGKQVKRLDKSINAIQKYIRDKTIDRIIKLSKGKNSKHLSEIKSRHRAALLKSYNISSTEENIFEITDDISKLTYVVKKVTSDSICCPLSCNYCNICIHSFECTCLDFLIRATICKHIHFININFLNRTDSVYVANSDNENKREIMDMVNRISTTNNTSNSKDSVECWKHKMQSQILIFQKNINTLNYTDEEMKHMFKQIKIFNNWGLDLTAKNSNNPFPSERDISAAPNKKIEKQLVFFSTKKKHSKKHLAKPNSGERKVIKETLSHSLITSNNPMNDHSYSKK